MYQAFIEKREPASLLTDEQPLVWIAGRIEPALRLVRYHRLGPLDRREVHLQHQSDASQVACAGKNAIVAVPRRLVDHAVVWQILAQGRLVANDGRTLQVHEPWSAMLDRPLRRTWWTPDGQTIRAGHAPPLRAGRDANRSEARFNIRNQHVHLPALTNGRLTWTLETALQTIAAMAGVRIEMSLLSTAQRHERITRDLDPALPLHRLSESLLEPHNLHINREDEFDRSQFRSTFVLRPQKAAAHISIPRHAVQAVQSHAHAVPAVRWLARGPTPRVESTFDLQPAWDPQLEGENDNVYSRTQSHDFNLYRNVFRRWVLNEDASFSRPPYNLASFALDAFFAQPNLVPVALAFHPCLTLDSSGEPEPVRVEISTDAGQTFSLYPGFGRTLSRRAGVYLDDDELPADFLQAAQQGEARLRVTASLISPQPYQLVRWTGNPFRQQPRTRTLDAHDAFAWRRIAPASIFHDDVNADQREADLADDRLSFARWFSQRIQEDTSKSHATATLHLHGPWIGPAPGERIQYHPPYPAIPVDGFISNIRADFDETGARTRVFIQLNEEI